MGEVMTLVSLLGRRVLGRASQTGMFPLDSKCSRTRDFGVFVTSTSIAP